MNERIREVWIKAAREDSDPDNWDTQEQFIERFAEFIVAECANVILETPVEYNEIDTMHRIRDNVKQHFGIEL